MCLTSSDPKTDNPINISGWKIKASNSEGVVGTRLTINPGTIIPARGHFLATNDNASGGYDGLRPGHYMVPDDYIVVVGDQTYSIGISDKGGVAITKPDDTIVDRLGMSDGSAFKEGRVVDDSQSDADVSHERKPGWGNGHDQDTNDNFNDFRDRYPSDPQNLHSPPSSPSNQLPIANPGGPYGGYTDAEIQFNGWGSSDPDGTLRLYYWDFGDGTSGKTQMPEHAYSTAGTYTVTLTVVDNAGSPASASTTVTVNQAPPPTPTPTLSPTPAPSSTPLVKVYQDPRLEPRNRVGSSGEDLLSGNFNWSLPLVGLKGRAGLDLGLALTYNSLTWSKDQDEQKIVFDQDQGFPSPGFRLGFPVIKHFDGEPIDSNLLPKGYTLIMPSGERIGLWQSSILSQYVSVDSSYLMLTRYYGDVTTIYLTKTDGTRYKFALYGDSYKCVEIRDSNGNYISASYDAQGRILTITDTLARVITFNYVGADLVSITQLWDGQSHVWARFEYEPLTIQPNFVKNDGTPLQAVGSGQTINALKRVVLADQSSYRFTHNAWGQVYKIAHHAADDHLLSYSTYDLPVNSSAALTDCPRFTERRDWAQFWNGDQEGVPAANEEAVTRFGIALDGEMGYVTLPDNATTFKEYYGTTTWQKGLTTKVETYYGGALKNGASIVWTQDNENITYQVNPRQAETKTYDADGNSRRTVNKYDTGLSPLRRCLLVEIISYNGNESNPVKHTLNYYDGSARINKQIVLSWVNQPVYIANVLLIANGYLKTASMMTYEYDLGGSYLVSQGTPPQHDNAYATSLIGGRGNLCVIRRWDADYPTDITKSVKFELGYNTTGSVIFKRDALGSATRQTDISYTDSNGGNTLAYPTKTTDPDNFSSTAEYDYDTGAVVRERNPKGAEQVTTYDAQTGRLQKQTLRDGVNNQDVTYTRFVYAPSQTKMESYMLVDNSVESYSSKNMDGAGNVIGIAGNHPGSAGGYRGQKFAYDVLRRPTGQTNPAEINNPTDSDVANWSPAGDDAGSWLWSYQKYDWNGRPTVTTNTDGTVREATYSGCGCAGGGMVVTLKGEQLAEGRRTQKIYSDALGREYKTEVLDWNGEVYKTTVNTYNYRDQITRAREYVGAEGSANYQDTTYSYDGFGRVRQRNNPAQTGGPGTTYTYYANDTVQTLTDARGATTTYEYNKRDLLSKMSYYAPPPAQWHTQIKIPSPTTFSYDSAGNRIEMTDELGSMTYEYDTLSRLKSETRYFNETVPQAPAGNQLKLQYTYTASGQLRSITDPFGEYIGYNHDSAGRLASVGGILPGGEQVQYATNAQYRAWGALKGLDYGTGMQMRMGFNNRLQAEEYSLLGRRYYYSNGQTDNLSINYQYYADGRLRFSEESHSQTHTATPLFARSYEYDFMGRLTLAKTGAEARGQVETDFNKRPYRQAFTYDAFGDMTKVDRWHWTQNYVTIPEGGTDEDGRPIGTYDAGGRMISDSEGIIDSTTFWRDGKGQMLRSHATGDACDPEIRCERTTYYIRSSVLGGKAVNELIQTYYPEIVWSPSLVSPARTDQKLETYIFAGGTRIAKHEIVANSGTYANRNHDTTYIENRDSSGAFFDEMILRGSGPVYNIGGAATTRPNYYLESDPFGADVSLRNPYIPPPPDDYGPPPCAGPEPDDCGYPEDDEEFSYSGSDYDEEGYGNPVEFTCFVEGMPRHCDEVFNHIERMGEDSFSYSHEGELLAPSSTGPQAIWKDEYKTKSLGDVVNGIDFEAGPEHMIAQVNIGVEDQGYFVLGNANWNTQEQTKQPRPNPNPNPSGGTGRVQPSQSVKRANIPCDAEMPTDSDQLAYVYTIMHEGTSPDSIGRQEYGTDKKRSGAWITASSLQVESRMIANAIKNYAMANNKSIYDAVHTDSYINDGKNFSQYYWDRGVKLTNEALASNINTKLGAQLCDRLKRAIKAAADPNAGLPSNLQHWKGVRQPGGYIRPFEPGVTYRMGDTDFVP